jgi:hypothetical protein
VVHIRKRLAVGVHRGSTLGTVQRKIENPTSSPEATPVRGTQTLDISQPRGMLAWLGHREKI